MHGRKMVRPRLLLKGMVVTILGILFIIMGLSVSAQAEALSVTLTDEQDIGFDCPVTATLDPEGTTVWVLMNSCGTTRYSLRLFDVSTGAFLNDDDHAYTEALAGLNDSYADFGSSVAVTSDGAISIIYSDSEYNMMRLTIPAAVDGSAATEIDTSDALVSLLADYAEYPETTVYNADHTLAAAIGTDSLHVLDLETETELLEIDMPGSPDNAFPIFSEDGQQLYVTQLNNLDDMTDYTSVLSVYSLPDGELLNRYDVPSFLIWVSPNGQYAAARLGANDGSSEDILVVDLTDNRVSEPISVFEPPHPVTTCLNSGNDVSDVDFTASGQLPVIDLEWLPDSSGFITLNSYGGEAAQGDSSVCSFNYSRLRHYAVQPAG
jgi:hypothetical protein